MELARHIAGIILPVLIVVLFGYAYARLRPREANSDIAGVNRITVDILAPLLIFTALASKDFDLAHNGVLILAGVLISLGSGLLAWPVARLLGYDPRSFLPPMMYNNCGNMGLPLAALAFGPSGLSAGVALFMAGNLVFFSAGIRIVSAGKEDRAPVLSLLFNPMMIGMALGLVFALLHASLPEQLMQAMKMAGDASIPLMLFALGVRMRDIRFDSWRIGMAGAVTCPLAGLAIAGLLDFVLPMTPAQRGQMYLFAALPPAVFCFIMAERYRQEPDKVASIVLLGNLASLVFVPAGLWLGLR